MEKQSLPSPPISPGALGTCWALNHLCGLGQLMILQGFITVLSCEFILTTSMWEDNHGTVFQKGSLGVGPRCLELSSD